MSDEPNPTGQSGQTADEWVMPKPTFRSSKGYTPGGAKREAVTGEMVADAEMAADDPARAITEEMPAYEAKAKGSGGSRSWLFVLALIALLAAAVAAYYLLFPTPVDTTF